ncbi:MAG: hypothetical protein RLZZ26_621 [Candidatus Parcubacteria bacterium]|jgi:hypothetical protein
MKSPFIHLIFWLLICAGVLIGYGVWYTTVTSKSAEVADLERQIVDKTQTSARAAATRTALAEIAGDETLVQSYFVSEAGVVPLIDDLQKRASSQSAEMKVLSVSTAGASAQGGTALLLTVSIDGTFDAVMRTVGTVEYAPYDISISKFAIHKVAKTSWHADLELTVGSIPAPSGGAPASP